MEEAHKAANEAEEAREDARPAKRNTEKADKDESHKADRKMEESHGDREVRVAESVTSAERKDVSSAAFAVHSQPVVVGASQNTEVDATADIIAKRTKVAQEEAKS